MSKLELRAFHNDPFYGSKEQWYTAASQKIIELLKQQN